MSGLLYDAINKGDAESEQQPLNAKYTPSTLQVKLQKQRDRMRKTQPVNGNPRTVITNAPKKTTLMSVARLQIPKSGYQKLQSSNSALIELNDSSGSEDEIFLTTKQSSNSARQVNKQLSMQLAKDGYQLDEMPDDEELDLIPPSDFRDGSTYSCCNAFNISCTIL